MERFSSLVIVSKSDCRENRDYFEFEVKYSSFKIKYDVCSLSSIMKNQAQVSQTWSCTLLLVMDFEKKLSSDTK